MALVSIYVNLIINQTHGKSWKDPTTYVFSKRKLDKDNTYLVIFSRNQEKSEVVFNQAITDNKIKLLYKSPKAVNKTYGHGEEPRNTLYVFELV